MILRTMKLGDVLTITDDTGAIVADLVLVQIEHDGDLAALVEVLPGPLVAAFELGIWPINERKVRIAIDGDSLHVQHTPASAGTTQRMECEP